MYLQLFVLESHKNQNLSKIVFSSAFHNGFFTFDPQSTNQIHFPIEQDT